MKESQPLAAENTQGDAGEGKHELEVFEQGETFMVCLGASAGGLRAVESFLSHIPLGHGLAFILVTHLNPHFETRLDEILSKQTKLKIEKALEGTVVKVDRIYVLPTNKGITIKEGILHLVDRVKAPVNTFLLSLAADQGRKAIAVILSGAGNDGVTGIRAIKDKGGLVIAQDPTSATQDGMPRRAIESKYVDIVASPEEIPLYILKWIKGHGIHQLELPNVPSVNNLQANDLQYVLTILRSHSGHDFSLYKKNTLMRRLERRMNLQNIESMPDYIQYLQSDAAERDKLFKEILIGVTSFFRDPEAFDVLKSRVIPYLLEHVTHEKSLRIWVPGCSTGEEAYSLAIAVLETLETKTHSLDLRIFASDIDKEAIEIAREGRYPKSISEDMSQERLDKFFIENHDEYKIRKEIKDKIIFAQHNSVRDPPFSKVDLISCRNLMIYFEPVLQQKVLSIFHYALNPGGILFMGSSETTGDSSSLFSAFDRKWKFFERKRASLIPSKNIEFDFQNSTMPPILDRNRVTIPSPRKPSIRDISQEALLAVFAPPSLICDGVGEILFINGRTSNYLEPAQGEARLNLFSMVKEEIRLEVSRGIKKVLSNLEEIRYTNLKIKKENGFLVVDIIIKPVPKIPFQQPLVIVAFVEKEELELPAESPEKIEVENPSSHTKELERELLFTREYMQTLVEQLETSNEELKSMNEELQSSNEELQSSNEELETAKEELQAVNEELVTLNAELQAKIEEVSTTNSDLDNFLSSSSMATLFLNRNFFITRFSRSATKIFNLIPSDVGRPLGDIASQIKYDHILRDAEEVLSTLLPIENEVELKDGRFLLMRMTPYKTINNMIDGVVIGFTDISEHREFEKLAGLFSELIEKSPASILAVNAAQEIVHGNETLCKALRYKQKELAGMHISILGLKRILTNGEEAFVLSEIQEAGQLWQGTIAMQGRLGSSVNGYAVAISQPLKHCKYMIVLLPKTE